MPYEDLNEFIELLDKEGEILRIHEPVSPQFEITEITDRVTKAGGPALLFENAQSPSGHPVAINLFGSIRRIKLAFKLNSLDELASDIMQFLEAGEAESFLQKLKLIPKVKRLANVFPKKLCYLQWEFFFGLQGLMLYMHVRTYNLTEKSDFTPCLHILGYRRP